MARSTCLFSLLLLLATPVLAQSGDRSGEVQQPLPENLKVPPAPVRTPEEQAATFTLAPGFRAELVAADPLIADPIAMQFGPDGRLWVIEMRGFMPNVDGEGEREPVGVIAVLTDTDGDGRYDQRSVFADKLIMPRAISLVGDGLMVAEPPHLWFMRDTNGDGVADEKTEIANDYGNINNPEHSANGLLWAMDNWIYSANYTARFRWQGGSKFLRENTVTRGQWGIAQDDAGRLFYNSNSDPLRHDAVPSAYLKRNPGFQASGANVQLVPSNLRIWPGRMTPGVNRGYRTLDEEFKLTSMTAASAAVVYRGTLFPSEFRGDAFVPEPSANLIKRIKLSENEGVLSGANAYEGREFMTSTDERFRPVSLYNGPDGALYVVDLYRGILQHRVYITSFLRKQILERGLDKGLAKGRIWRIVPDGAPKARYASGLATASGAQLVAKLSDENGWVRDTAQRLLVEKRGAGAVADLRQAALDAKRPAVARLHALWALEGVGGEALDRATVSAALKDPAPRVAAAAVRLSESFLRIPEQQKAVVAELAKVAAARAEPEVRLQLALTLGEARTAEADAVLRDLAVRSSGQKYLAEAIVSGLGGREIAFVEALVKAPGAEKRASEVIRLATSAVARVGKAPQLEQVLALTTAEGTPEWARGEMIAGLRLSLPRSPDGKTLTGRWPVEPKALVALAAKDTAPSAKAARELLALVRWPGKPGQAAAVRPMTEAEQALFEKGKTAWAATCAACHQPNGQGLAGLAPSLVNSKWVLGDPRLMARIILNGKTQENMVMPPWKAALNDETIAALMTFIRRSWDHDADPVAPGVVADVRRDVSAREEPFTEAELQELAQTLRPQRRRAE
jgi:glucose/arabinose dehydrogenase/mono/diheme cytochrome c family protein